MTIINKKGYRSGIGIIIINQEKSLFWAKRIGQEAFQFPQGGLKKNETATEALFRELKEEVGLNKEDVTIIASTRDWLKYKLPEKLVRHELEPLCIGQRLKFFLLALKCNETHIRFDHTDHPEFDDFRWVSYQEPYKRVVHFKQKMYQRALKEFEPFFETKASKHD